MVSAGIVSASDLDDASTDILTQSSAIDSNEINHGNKLEIMQTNQEPSKGNGLERKYYEEPISEDNLELMENSQGSSCDSILEIAEDTQLYLEDGESRIIYVGQNKTSDGGNGTEENPFGSFELACNNLTGEDKVEINVFNGTYYLDSDLRFNTSNLFITGIGEVNIKYLRNEPGIYASFGLTFTYGNFTFSNLIFDATNFTIYNGDRHFIIFMGEYDLGVFNNCSFINFIDARVFEDMGFSYPSIPNRKFNHCNFLGSQNNLGLILSGLTPINMEFDYCTVSSGLNIGTGHFSIHTNITFNNMWLGKNSYPGYISYVPVADDGLYLKGKTFPVNRYAIISAWENYLGNDSFEIAGKLTWDDNTTDGIDELYPLTVNFFTKTGELPSNVTTENGSFSAIYKSNSKDNHIELEVDKEEGIVFDFKNDIQVSVEPIFYGDDQNVSVVLPQSSQGIAYITVNNITYDYPIDNLSSFNFTVPDELLAGTYIVDVKLVDTLNHLYGEDSVEWIVSQIDKELFIQTPADANVDDESIFITILLDDRQTGNITVYAGENNKTVECLGGNKEIDIKALLSGGDNLIKVFYSGNKRYINQTKSTKLTVNRINPKMNVTMPANPRVDDDNIYLNISLPANATGNITVSVKEKKKTITDLTALNTIDISDLIIGGLNTVYIRYSGDDWWDMQNKKETIEILKLNPLMDANLSSSTVLVDEIFNLIVNLSGNCTGEITANINGNVFSSNLSDSLALFNLSSAISGLNKINVSYGGDDYHYPLSNIVDLTVLKRDITSDMASISITDHTSPSFSISLPADATGRVSVKINEKEYWVDLTAGRASLTLNDLNPGAYDAIVTYLGNYKYNSLSTALKFSVPNPVLKSNDFSMLYTSGKKYGVYVTASGSPVVGKTVIFTVNGKKISAVTDSRGYASVKINLPPRAAKYKLSCEYQGVKINNKVKVRSIILAKNLKVKKSAKMLKIKVSLKKVNGKYLKAKKLTLKFRGKKYSAKTNKRGIAIFKIKKNIIKKLKKGKKYTYKVTYLKDSSLKKVSVKK